MFSTNQPSYLRPVHKLEEDFPFLFKVIEFRIFLHFLPKEERERYSRLWFAREKKLASMSPSELNQESKNHIKALQEKLNINSKDEIELSKIHISSLHKDLLWLTRYKLPGNILRAHEDQLLLELTSWVNETEDDAIISFFTHIMGNATKNSHIGGGIRIHRYYWMKACQIFSLLDCINNIQTSSIQDFINRTCVDRLTTDVPLVASLPIKSELIFNRRAGAMFFPVAITGTLFILASLLKVNPDISLGWYGVILFSLSFVLISAKAVYDVQSACRQVWTDSLQFSENFAPLINSFLKKIIEDLFAKRCQLDYQYQLADLSSLVHFLSSSQSSIAANDEQDEMEEKQEKVKKRPLRPKELDFIPVSNTPKEENHCESIIKNGETSYILLRNNKYVKLTPSKLAMLFQSVYPKASSDDFIKEVLNTIERHQEIDKLSNSETDGKKALFRGCTHKLRINRGLYPRLGFYSRKPTPYEENLNVTEIYSPRKVVMGHKKGYTL